MQPQFLCQCSVLGLSLAEPLTCKLMFLLYSAIMDVGHSLTFFYWIFCVGNLYCDFLLLPTDQFELWQNILDILIFVSCWFTIVPLFKHPFFWSKSIWTSLPLSVSHFSSLKFTLNSWEFLFFNINDDDDDNNKYIDWIR